MKGLNLSIKKILGQLLTASRLMEAGLWLQARPAGRNAVLALVNLLLVVVLVFQFNPIGIFATGYESASPLISLEQEDVQEIAIKDPDFKNARIKLVRQGQLSRSQWFALKTEKEKSFLTSLYSYTPTQYRWQLKVYTTAEQQKEEQAKSKEKTEEVTEVTYVADVQRIAEFFESLKKARRYYSVPRTSEKEKSLGMQKNSQGEYAGLEIQFSLADGKKTALFLGRSTKRGNESYVRRDEEGQIYLVMADLRNKSGSGEISHFRDRLVFPEAFIQGQIVSLLGRAGNTQTLSHLVYDGKEWRLQYPPTTDTLRQDSISSFIKDLLNWKTKGFPQEPPTDLNQKFAFNLIIRYKATQQTNEKEFVLEVLGRKGYSDYTVRMPDQSLREISSVYIEDFLEPLKNFTEPKKP